MPITFPVLGLCIYISLAWRVLPLDSIAHFSTFFRSVAHMSPYQRSFQTTLSKILKSVTFCYAYFIFLHQTYSTWIFFFIHCCFISPRRWSSWGRYFVYFVNYYKPKMGLAQSWHTKNVLDERILVWHRVLASPASILQKQYSVNSVNPQCNDTLTNKFHKKRNGLTGHPWKTKGKIQEILLST